VVSFRFRFERYVTPAGLLAASWVAWATSAPPHSNRTPALLRLQWTIGTGLLALSWSSVVALALWFLTRRLSRVEPAPPRLRISSVAAWFAAGVILLLQSSPLCVAAGLALLAGATRLLYAPEPAKGPALFSPVSLCTEAPRHFGAAFVIATCLQAAVVAHLMRDRFPAAGLLALGTVLLASTAIHLGAWTRDRPLDLRRSLLALGLIVLAGLAGRMVIGGGGYETAAASKGSALPSASKRSNTTAAVPIPGVKIPGGYPGVIIWPEVQSVTMLVAPPAPRGHGGISVLPHPLSIPFSGEYWMFRWPFHRPPANSWFQRGSPLDLHFTTTDRERLLMEARQKLLQPISLTCCRSLQLALRNADARSNSMVLELALLKQGLPEAAVQSLGFRPIVSIPKISPEAAQPVAETLEYTFPSSPRLAEFDEIRVVFHLSMGRVDKSARVAIERFVLLPRW
jgi:hypothetical protein